MSDPVYVVSPDVSVTITVHDPDVIERVTGPYGDEWRAHFYPLHTIDDVLNHLAFNAATNGVHDISRLDGWGDLDESAVTVEAHWDDGGVTRLNP